MTFYKNGLVFVKERVVQREGKKDLTFVTLADPNTYESNDFLLNDKSQSNFGQGDLLDVELEVEGRYSNVFLIPAPA